LGYTSETGQDYTEKMAKYYGHELSYSLRELKGDWLGATLWTSGGCTWTNYLDRREWEDDLWKGVLAHEWAHSFLGKNCISNHPAETTKRDLSSGFNDLREHSDQSLQPVALKSQREF